MSPRSFAVRPPDVAFVTRKRCSRTCPYTFILVCGDSLRRRLGFVVGLEGVTLGNSLVVDEEEGEEHEVSRGKGDPRDYVDRLGHPYGMRRLLLPHLMDMGTHAQSQFSICGSMFDGKDDRQR